MDIQVNDVSKIYGTGENKVVALCHANMTIHPVTSSPLCTVRQWQKYAASHHQRIGYANFRQGVVWRY